MRNKFASYWRHSLADASLLGNQEKVLAQGLELNRHQFKDGMLDKAIAEKLFKNAGKDAGEKSIRVLICPVVLRRIKDHAQGKNSPVIPICIETGITLDGKLFATDKIWMSRENLEPLLESP